MNEETKKCPFCGNLIPLKAQKCRFCSHDVEEILQQNDEREENSQQLSFLNVHTNIDNSVKCPFCEGLISPNVQKCKHCGSWVNGHSESSPKVVHSLQQAEQNPPTKICPVCGNKIPLPTRKCPHCNEWIEKENKKPSVFYRTAKTIVDVLMVIFAVVCGLPANDWLVGLLIAGAFYLVLAVYFLPTVIAGNKGHRHTPAIGILNLFFGVTVIVWVILLVYAVTDEK